MAHIETEVREAVLAPPYLDLLRPKPTGNVLITLRQGDTSSQLRTLEQSFRTSTSSHTAVAHAMSSSEIGDTDFSRIEEPVLLKGYGIGIVPATELTAGVMALTFRESNEVLESRPEFFMFSMGIPETDSGDRTWGTAAVEAATSSFSGRGIRIAVLDTGIDSEHPDFQDRRLVTRSFVAGASVTDISGHGTHCAGTAAGRRAGGNRPRYGTAPDAELYIGKVLDDGGRGAELDILAGMAWALEEKCHIISMSLGHAVQPNQTYSRAYERLGLLALESHSIIIAAAGNNSSRQFGFIAPVAAPANSPSIVAVAAIDPTGDVADFSCGGLNSDGGAINLAAPGVNVFSSYPRPETYRSLSGTSMACPHVAGVAALWAESDPELRGRKLLDRLKDTALALGGEIRDIGGGLVQAPTSADASTLS